MHAGARYARAILMNPQPVFNAGRSGITLLELTIAMAVLGVAAVLVVWPRMTVGKTKAQRIHCMSRLKQIGLSTRQWAMDHGGDYPPGVAITNGGTLGHPLFSQAWIHFQLLSNEISSPVILVCPADRKMRVAADFGAGFGNNNVSYFMSVDAVERKPQMLLAGDRNLSTNGVRVTPGLYTMNTNHLLGWDKAIHRNEGNAGLADGSVQQMTSFTVNAFAACQDMTNRLAIP